MIKGILLDETSVVTDIPEEFSFAYIRARKIGKDDQKFSYHKDLVTNKGIPYGVFIELDYINPKESNTDPAHPTKQAQELADKDRGFPQLLPILKVIPYVDHPISGNEAWKNVATLLSDTIYWYKTTFGKRNVGVSTNISSFNGMISFLTNNISEAWLDVIALRETPPTLNPPYGRNALWESTLYDQTVSGATKVGIVYWPGTLSELLAWKGTLSTIPDWDSTPVEPTPPPPEEEPTLDLTPVLDKIEDLNANLNTRMDDLTTKILDFMNGWSK